MQTAYAFLIAILILAVMVPCSVGLAAMALNKSWTGTWRIFWPPITGLFWSAFHPRQARAYAALSMLPQEGHTAARRGWTPEHIRSLLMPHRPVNRLSLGSMYAAIARAITPDRFQAWEPHLGAVLHSRGGFVEVDKDDALFLTEWDTAVGPLAPLAAAAGYRFSEAAAQRGELDEDTLRMLITLRQPADDDITGLLGHGGRVLAGHMHRLPGMPGSP